MLSPKAEPARRDGNVVAKGLDLLLSKRDPGQCLSYFNSCLKADLGEEERNRSIQFRDAAAAALVRMELENGDTYAKLGRFGSALEIYSSIHSDSHVPVMLHFQMLINSGACLARLGRKEEALTKQLKALALNPSSTKTLKNIAILLADMGHYKEGVHAFDVYLCEHPESYSALCGKAGCLKDLRLYIQSEATAELAQLLDPKMLRGQCAQDIIAHCRQELLKMRYGNETNHSIKVNSDSLASYFLPPSKSKNNGDFKFDLWLETIKKGFGDRDIYEDYNLPQHSRGETLHIKISDDQCPARSPRKFIERVIPISVRIPGNDLSVESTPNRPDVFRESGNRRATSIFAKEIPHSGLVSDLTPDVYMEPSKQEIKQNRITPMLNHSIRPMSAAIPLSTNFTRGGELDHATLIDQKLRMKYPIRLGLKKEVDNPAASMISSPFGAEVTSPLSVSMSADHRDFTEWRSHEFGVSRPSTINFLSERDTHPSPVIPATRRRPAPFQTVEEESSTLNSPTSLCTPSKASAPPRAAAVWDSHIRENALRGNREVRRASFSHPGVSPNVNMRGSVVDMKGAVVPSSSFADKKGTASSSSQLTIRGSSNISVSKSSKIQSDLPDRSSREAYRDSAYYDTHHDHDTREGEAVGQSTNLMQGRSLWQTDTHVSMKSTSSVASTARDSMTMPSGKPGRRSINMREVSDISDNRLPDPLDMEKLVDLNDNVPSASSGASESTVSHYRIDRVKDHIPPATLDLFSPYVGASDERSTRTTSYENLRDSGKSVESRTSIRELDSLDEEEFRLVFEMTRVQWNMLPSWQRAREKKLLDLF